MNRHIISIIIIAIGWICTVTSCGSDQLAVDFVKPPKDFITGTYWYWINGNVSETGVVNDLISMKKAGVNSAFIGFIGGQEVTKGDAQIFSEKWWKVLHTALKTATELDIEIGLFNCPGWSHMGGPWVKEEQSMRHLTASETYVTGGKTVNIMLPIPQQETHFKAWSEDLVDNEGQPAKFFQDVKVLALPVNDEYQVDLFELPDVKVMLHNAKHVAGTVAYCLAKVDQRSNIAPRFVAPLGEVASVTLKVEQDKTARSLKIYPASHCQGKGILKVKVNGVWQQITEFNLNRANPFMNLGFKPFAPITVGFQEVTSNEFCIELVTTWREAAIGKIVLSPTPIMDQLPEKILAKVTHAWSENMIAMAGNDNVNELTDNENIAAGIDTNQIVDLTELMQADGKLIWNAPEGKWLVLRLGMVPSEIYNAPAENKDTGYEIDKLNSDFMQYHFDSFIGEVLRRIPQEDRQTFQTVIVDSWEKGAQIFTDDLIDDFETRYGYDPTPLLPLLVGYMVGSADVAERFLWDMRRLAADRIGENLMNEFSRICHQNNLKTWVENYGEEFAGECLLYGKYADMVGGEFWMAGTAFWNNTRFIDVAASTAHIYDKKSVYAEAFTSRDTAFVHHPKTLKGSADAAFAAGVTRMVLHVNISQIDSNQPLGIQTWFGTEFNRKNIWFEHADMFTMYLKRVGVMLEYGTNVADIAYFIGEDVPMGSGPFGINKDINNVELPQLPNGYHADYVNADVILHGMDVENGNIILPHGISYKILVLPPFDSMRPDVLRKIEWLVDNGATILGNPPRQSPSLKDFPNADREVERIARVMWGDGKERIRKYKNGLVLANMSIKEALDRMKVVPDMDIERTNILSQNVNVVFHHRSSASKDVYFVANQSELQVQFLAMFRVQNSIPYLWNPIDGSVRLLPTYVQNKETISVPMQLEPLESTFIVFEKMNVFDRIVSMVKYKIYL